MTVECMVSTSESSKVGEEGVVVDKRKESLQAANMKAIWKDRCICAACFSLLCLSRLCESLNLSSPNAISQRFGQINQSSLIVVEGG